MFTYVLRRTLAAIPLLLLISIILFVILNNAPGGPLAPYLQNPHITPADIERLKHNLGLDKPIWYRYLAWLGQIFHGDFGYSTSNSEPVLQAIGQRIGATIELMGVSFVVALGIGLSAGMFSAVRPYSFADYFITTLAFFGQSMPVFWFALMLQLLFAVHGIPLPGGYEIVLPSAGRCSTDTCTFGDAIEHLVLPVIVLALLNLALYSRFMRSSLLEVTKTDYMRTAAAKGLGPGTILFKHGLKNALIPVVTIVALSFPGVLGGAIVTEQIFAWPGAGRMFYAALQQSDIALMMGYLLIIAVAVVFSNLIADLLYAWLDPRVRYD
ncbi:MAG TPA: ABC transporter permease [Candidatus Baltobacteraceae bacterium]|nr:ABC transporter permease [Candidatus Baltobacteraceae bacterium]